MQNIIEYVEDFRNFSEVITEEINGNQQLFLEGIFAQFEVFNANNRWYQLREGEAVVNDFNMNRIPRRDKIFGELDHSTESSPQFHRMALIFETPLRIDNNNLIARARVLDNTLYGQTLRVVLEEKLKFGASTKGVGNLSNTRKVGKRGKLVSNWQLKNVGDIVVDQSAPNAVPMVIMEMIMSGDKRMEKIFGTEIVYNTQNDILITKKSDLDEKTLKIWNKLMNINI